jgi:uncharacterized repeat protein (TIGR01451 family)
VIDQVTGNTATLECWSLFISPEECTDGGGECPGSDLSISMTANPISTITGGTITYTMVVSNAGPSDAKNVAVVQNLPAGLQYLESTTTQGSLVQSGSTLTFTLGAINALGTATITVYAYPTQSGFFTSTATVGFPGTDPNPDNNFASTSVLVSKPSADLVVTMTGLPTTVPEGGQVTFTMGVTNKGPSTANGVTLTNFLPANANVVYSSSPSAAVVPLGTLAKDAGASVTLILSPTAVGTCSLTSTAGLSAADTDPNPENNTASFTVDVVPASDLQVSAVATPSPALSGKKVSYLVTVTNAGPSPATTVVVSQTVPAGATFQSTSSTNASYNSGVVTWNVGNMPSGTSQFLTNVVTATNLLTGVASNVMVSTLTVFGQPANPYSNNTAVVSTLVLRPVAILSPAGANLDYESLSPPNGAVNPGETVGVRLYLQNTGNIPTTNLTATLLATGGVTAPSGPANYGAVAAGGGVTNEQFYFTANSTNGGTVVATLSLYDGPTNYLGTASFTFVMPVVTSFWNTNFISIPAQEYTNNPASGPANPYPSTNWVYGITSYVANITVTVSNLYHPYPSDIELLLVGPGGQNSLLMSYAALGTEANIPVTLTFDQTASSPVSAAANLLTGSYQPAAYNAAYFIPPAPTNGFATNLSVFTGLPANGTWQLFAYDDSDGDYGGVSNGWGLSVTTLVPVNQTTDLGVGILAASPNPVFVGSNITFTIGVTNYGTNNVTNLFLTNWLSSGLTFVSTNAPAPVSPAGPQFYNLGALDAGSNLTFNIVATATNAGSLSDTVSVGSTLTDLNPANNTATAPAVAVNPSAALFPGVSASDAAGAVLPMSSVLVGSGVVYTLVVTNSGPNEALNVAGVLNQSGPGYSSNVFATNFNFNIDPGATASALYSNALMATGPLTNTWTVTTTSINPNAASNAAPLVFTVIPPEPIIVANGVRLLSGSTNGGINSNQTVVVAFTLENVGATASSPGLTATLLTTNGVFPTTNGALTSTETQTYGAISPGASGTQNFQFIGSGAPGSTITAVLALHDSAFPSDSLLGTVSNSFVIPGVASFTNSAFISIPEIGTATPYPSSILVSAPAGQLVGKVTASLNNFTHTFPQDVNVLLVGPAGQQALLMAHAGGPFSVANLMLGFDPAATTTLPVTQMSSSTNLPTQDGASFDTFPGVAGTPSNTNLNVFNGSNPNGFWSLYILDDTAGNAGSVVNGWTLNLTLVNPVNPPGTLAVGMTNSPNPVLVGNYLTSTVVVTNLGLASATNVVLTQTLPAGTSLVSAAASQGAVVTSVPGAITYNFGTITNSGGAAWATNVVQPALAGVFISSATATNASTFSSATAANTITVNTLETNFSLTAVSLPKSVRLTLSGQAGQNYVIQVSTNLASWSPISTNLAVGGGAFSITNSVSIGPARFYRAVHYPQ